MEHNSNSISVNLSACGASETSNGPKRLLLRGRATGTTAALVEDEEEEEEEEVAEELAPPISLCRSAYRSARALPVEKLCYPLTLSLAPLKT